MDLRGEYEGIGAYVNTDGEYLTITEPISGSPAEKAGLLPGDQIIAIDGEDMTGTLPEIARMKVLGPKGTVVILTIFLNLLRHFVWRACALEGLGVQESFRRGWELVRENWKSVGLMWLVMIGLGIVWAVASIILVIITIPLVFVSAGIAAIPILLLSGLFSMFLSNTLAWVLAILFILPLFLTMAFFPLLVLGGWQAVFTSSVWTLTYREIKAIPNGKVEVQELPAAS